MKKIVTITINKSTFNIDEDAFKILSDYLDDLKYHFDISNDNGKEIIEDVEARIAEILNEKIIPTVKEVISMDDVKEVIKIMGTVEDFEKESDKEQGNNKKFNSKNPKLLFRDTEHSIFGGVAAGLGAYFNLDPLWMRIIFIFLFFVNGFGLILYLVLWIIVPAAKTTTQKLQMRGNSINISNIKKNIQNETKRIKSKAENFKNSDKYSQLKHSLNNILISFGTIITFLFKFIIKIIGVLLLIGVIILLFTIVFGISFNFHSILPDNITFQNIILNLKNFNLIVLCLLFIVGIPLLGIITGIFKFLFNIKSENHFLKRFGFTLWIIALILFIILLFRQDYRMPVSISRTKTYPVTIKPDATLYLDIKSFTYNELDYYNIFNYEVIHIPLEDKYLGKPELDIRKAKTDSIKLEIITKYHFGFIENKNNTSDHIDYKYSLNDSVLLLDQYFFYDEKEIWKMPELLIILKIPENTHIYISEKLNEFIDNFESEDFLLEKELLGKKLYMSETGLKKGK